MTEKKLPKMTMEYEPAQEIKQLTNLGNTSKAFIHAVAQCRDLFFNKAPIDLMDDEEAVVISLMKLYCQLQSCNDLIENMHNFIKHIQTDLVEKNIKLQDFINNEIKELGYVVDYKHPTKE